MRKSHVRRERITIILKETRSRCLRPSVGALTTLFDSACHARVQKAGAEEVLTTVASLEEVISVIGRLGIAAQGLPSLEHISEFRPVLDTALGGMEKNW